MKHRSNLRRGLFNVDVVRSIRRKPFFVTVSSICALDSPLKQMMTDAFGKCVMSKSVLQPVTLVSGISLSLKLFSVFRGEQIS